MKKSYNVELCRIHVYILTHTIMEECCMLYFYLRKRATRYNQKVQQCVHAVPQDTTKKFNNVRFTSMTLLNGVGLWNITMGCLELNLNLSLPASLFEHPIVIFRGSII